MKSLREITSERLGDVIVRELSIEGAAIRPALEAVKKEATHLIDRVIVSFGGCEKCYGKGYGTETVHATTFPDFEGDIEITKQMPVMNFCACARGQQLRKLVSLGKVAP